MAFRALNLGYRISRRQFRVHVHRTTAVDAAARGSGLSLRHPHRAWRIWQVVLHARGG